MKALRVLGFSGMLTLWSFAASGAPIYGVSAFVFTDAGRAHTFQNVQFDPIANVLTTGVITQALNDDHFGGVQSAATSAYASVGSLGGKVQAFSVFGSSIDSAQAADDLSWYFDWIPKGNPGEVVKVQFSELFEGVVVGNGTGFSGGAHATSTVGGTILIDANFTLLTPGPFKVLVSKVFEFTVGDIVHLGSSLKVGGHAELNSSLEVDAFNTSKFFVDVLTPGAGYNSSDFLFPTLIPPPGTEQPPTPVAVPEPSSFALCGGALFAFLMLRRSKNPR